MMGLRRFAWGLAAVAASLVVASCTAVRPRIDFTPSFAVTAELGRADELVRAGCYKCLTEALAIYEQLAAGPVAVPVAPYRAVDTAILLAVRERELGLGSGRSQQRAIALARELPAPADYSQYLQIIDTINWKPAGVSAEQQDAILGSYRVLNANYAGWRTNLQASASRDLLSAYLLVSYDCLYSVPHEGSETDGVAPSCRFATAAARKGVDVRGREAESARRPASR